ncbi:protein S100-A3 [Notamacropus eugenii]|uniref:protein S100-A3 n=1 Tax=Notamacropus eugenii TaxID=9315 RepID=UPI003B675AD9
MPSTLEEALAAIVDTFQQYSARSGDKFKLSQCELKELLLKELPTLAPTRLRECDYNTLMSALDTNKDCEVDFTEYVRALACLCIYCHEYFRDCPPNPPCP